MNSKLVSMMGRTWIAPYERLVWFALWNIAREQRLNIVALAAYSQRLVGAYVQGMRHETLSGRHRHA